MFRTVGRKTGFHACIWWQMDNGSSQNPGKKLNIAPSEMPDVTDGGSASFEKLTPEELERLKRLRNERYTDPSYYNSYASTKKVSKRTVISVIVLIFLYYIAIFVLKLTGVTNALVTAGLALVGVAVVCIVYWIYKKKNGV